MPNTRSKQPNKKQPERASESDSLSDLELAAMLRCHPTSIPRFRKTKPGFPQASKPFGKNLTSEAEARAYLQSLLAKKTEAA